MSNYKSSYTRLKEKIEKQQKWLNTYSDIVEIYQSALYEISFLDGEKMKNATGIAQVALLEAWDKSNETR